jgi:hypothetical protein
MDHAEMTKGKNMVISDELRGRMINPYNLEISVWKENVLQKPAKRVKPTSAMLIEKYQRQLDEDWNYRVTRGIEWDRFFEARNRPHQQGPWCIGEPRRRRMQHSTDWEPGIKWNPRFADRSGSGNPDHRVNHPDVLRDEGGWSRRLEQIEEHIVMVGSWPCKVSFEIHIIGQRISEPVHEDKGNMMATGPEDRRDPKRARVVLSKGRKVVGPGYSRVTGVAAQVTEKKENLGNHGRVSQNSNTDQQAVGWPG